jgi:hypothetical protein
LKGSHVVCARSIAEVSLDTFYIFDKKPSAFTSARRTLCPRVSQQRIRRLRVPRLHPQK